MGVESTFREVARAIDELRAAGMSVTDVSTPEQRVADDGTLTAVVSIELAEFDPAALGEAVRIRGSDGVRVDRGGVSFDIEVAVDLNAGAASVTGTDEPGGDGGRPRIERTDSASVEGEDADGAAREGDGESQEDGDAGAGETESSDVREEGDANAGSDDVESSASAGDADGDAGEATENAGEETENDDTEDAVDVEASDCGSDADDRAAGDGRPPHHDPERLREVYEAHDTFAEMTDALGVDVTAQTVRHHMIKHGIHEPRSNGSRDGRAVARERGGGRDETIEADGSTEGDCATGDDGPTGDEATVEGTDGDRRGDAGDGTEASSRTGAGVSGDRAGNGANENTAERETVAAAKSDDGRGGSAEDDADRPNTATGERAGHDDGERSGQGRGDSDGTDEDGERDAVDVSEVDVAGESDAGDVAGESDAGDVAGESDAGDVAGESDAGDVAGESGRRDEESPVDASGAVDASVDLPPHLTIDRIRDAVQSSDTLYQAQRKLDVDDETATRLLRELDLLDLVTGRLATKRDREVSRDEIDERIRAATAPGSRRQRESGDA